MTCLVPFQLTPEYRDYVWGGDLLRPGIVPTAEAWVVYAEDLVASGPYRGRKLADLAKELGADLLGQRAVDTTGERFPLLVKFLDSAQWLSLQVHPNDQQAVALEGPGYFGKTEAWYVLQAKPGAQLIAGLIPGTDRSEMEEAIRNGQIAEYSQYLDVHPGDTLFIAPGTVHALGPGLLIYEIQQTSDLTYRVFDWGRPQTPTRKLHIEESIQVANPAALAKAAPEVELPDGGRQVVVQCPYFTLESMKAQEESIELDTGCESFHAVTLIEGKARLVCGSEQLELEKFGTAIIPACAGRYRLIPGKEGFQALKASV